MPINHFYVCLCVYRKCLKYFMHCINHCLAATFLETIFLGWIGVLMSLSLAADVVVAAALHFKVAECVVEPIFQNPNTFFSYITYIFTFQTKFPNVLTSSFILHALRLCIRSRGLSNSELKFPFIHCII